MNRATLNLNDDVTKQLLSGAIERLLIAAPARQGLPAPRTPGVEQLLMEKIEEARLRYEAASDVVLELAREKLSGTLQPDLVTRTREAFEHQRGTRADLAKALEQFDDFLLHGVLPEVAPAPADRSRERELEAALFCLYKAWSRLPVPRNRLRPFFAEKFRQMIVPGCKLYKHGPEAVRHVLYRSKNIVLAHLAENNRLDLSVEALVLSGQWDDLFNAHDRKTAAERLEQATGACPAP